MRITRLDTVTENFVNRSTKENINEQILYSLQDLNATVAMIYDNLFGEKEEVGSPIVTEPQKAEAITYVEALELKPQTKLYLDHVELPEGYDVTFEAYDEETNEDMFYAFGTHAIRFHMSKYGKEWRLWTKKPTPEERNEVKWKK